MIWPVGELLRYADERSGLFCGDAVFTGTPAGVGHTSGRYLSPADVIDVTIEGIGSISNVVGKAG
jgi:2-keto-4-pentenoate hydratase/2-oxohepta-3-ene-1,7-dioic acid hydratase in catechol pathway